MVTIQTSAVTARVQELYDLDETEFAALLQRASKAIQQRPEKFYELDLYNGRRFDQRDEGQQRAGLLVYSEGRVNSYVLLIETAELIDVPYGLMDGTIIDDEILSWGTSYRNPIIRSLYRVIHDWA